MLTQAQPQDPFDPDISLGSAYDLAQETDRRYDSIHKNQAHEFIARHDHVSTISDIILVTAYLQTIPDTELSGNDVLGQPTVLDAIRVLLEAHIDSIDLGECFSRIVTDDQVHRFEMMDEDPFHPGVIDDNEPLSMTDTSFETTTVDRKRFRQETTFGGSSVSTLTPTNALQQFQDGLWHAMHDTLDAEPVERDGNPLIEGLEIVETAGYQPDTIFVADDIAGALIAESWLTRSLETVRLSEDVMPGTVLVVDSDLLGYKIEFSPPEIRDTSNAPDRWPTPYDRQIRPLSIRFAMDANWIVTDADAMACVRPQQELSVSVE